MDRLSSCYFCGAALDATLDEYPVVPSALRPDADPQTAIVLCGTCRRKLDAVLGTVVEAVETDAGEVVGESDADDGNRTATADDTDIGSTLGDDNVLESPGRDDPVEEGPVEASETEFGGDRTAADGESEAAADTGSGGDSSDGDSDGRKYTDSRGAGFRRDDGPTESGSLTGGAFSDDDESPGRHESRSRSPSSGSSAVPSDGSGDASSGDGSDGDTSSGDGSDGDGGSSGDGSGTTGTDRDVSMTRLENMKVMRLLENREFPVDRDEFVAVAASAYQISRDDCERVIELAVDHGLLREDDGQLYGVDS